MIACTSSILNQKLVQDVNSVGFDDIVQAPLQSNILETFIIPMLQKKNQVFNDKKNILEIMNKSYS